MQSERWNWLDDGVLPLLLAGMRAAWLWPWLTLLHAWVAPSQPAPVLPLAALIGVPLLSFSLARRLIPPSRDPTQTARFSARRMGVAALGLLALVLLLWWHYYRLYAPPWDPAWLIALGNDLTHWAIELPVQVLALLAGVYLWLRGVLDARASLHHDDIWRTFVAGSLALALYFGLAQVSVDTAPGAGWLLVFFACGTAALAVTNLKTASGWSLLGRATGGRLQATRYWVLSILLTIGGLLALGLLLGWLIAPEEVAWLLNAVGLVFSLLGRVLYVFALALSYVFFAIFYVLYWLLGPLIRRLQEQETEREPELPEPMGTPEPMPELEFTDPAAIPEPFRWIGLAVAVLLIFVIFVVVLYRLRRAPEEEAEEVRESIYSADLLQDQWAAFWQRWRDRFRRTGERGPAFADLSGEIDTRRAIRAIYQRVLATAAGLGTPRAAAQTPLEYEPDLERTLLAAGEPLEIITRGYNEARYGADPPSPETARQVQQSWQTLQARLNRDGEDGAT